MQAVLPAGRASVPSNQKKEGLQNTMAIHPSLSVKEQCSYMYVELHYQNKLADHKRGIDSPPPRGELLLKTAGFSKPTQAGRQEGQSDVELGTVPVGTWPPSYCFSPQWSVLQPVKPHFSSQPKDRNPTRSHPRPLSLSSSLWEENPPQGNLSSLFKRLWFLLQIPFCFSGLTNAASTSK